MIQKKEKYINTNRFSYAQFQSLQKDDTSHHS